MRYVTAITAIVAVLAFIGAVVFAATRKPEAAPYIVPILAVGIAVALQKYTASFFAYFVLTFTRIYTGGDRIRIGNIKGDVRRIGLMHTTLEEVGEDEKLGGELTGRIVHVPNLVILDQPVLNYSKAHSVYLKAIRSDYMFDEVRIPITTTSNVEKACQLLEKLIKTHDEPYMREADKMFKASYPKFFDEARGGPRVLVHVEPQHIWVKGKFVAPVRGRNDLRTRILLHFLREAAQTPDIRLA